MNFGDILRSWEEERSTHATGSSQARKGLEAWIAAYPPDGSKDAKDPIAPSGGPDGVELRNAPHDATLDLHGLRLAEAEQRTNAFLRDAHSRGLRKVLIIHGKGVHSTNGPVLRDGIRRFLERHPFAGRIDVPPARFGGRGALWVIVRYRSR